MTTKTRKPVSDVSVLVVAVLTPSFSRALQAASPTIFWRDCFRQILHPTQAISQSFVVKSGADDYHLQSGCFITKEQSVSHQNAVI